MTTTRSARLIAFYLPQFHAIPENDAWWGKGFTEWTNVAKAKPLFKGHYQPRIPADLGFYNLLMPETRIAQAELANAYGIEGFCYWHYWFAGKQLLERPLKEILKSGEPNFPFCLGWANDSWTGIWHGCPDRMLIEQTYPGQQDEEKHFYALIEAFHDERYIKIGNKPLFLIYKPYLLPHPYRFIEHWNSLAIKEDLPGVYFVANVNSMLWNAKKYNFDALTPHNPGITTYHIFNRPPNILTRIIKKFTDNDIRSLSKKIFKKPDILEYAEFINHALPELKEDIDGYPCVIPNWDSTPRCGINGYVLHDSTPELWRLHLQQAIQQVASRSMEKKIIFVKSWNEWGECNYLEPDLKFGRAYLEVCKDEVMTNN